MPRHRWPVTLCLLIAVAYAASKIPVAFSFWFEGIVTWPKLFRPFPDWGTGPDLYGALLPAKWIGTRTMWYAAALFAVTWFVFLFRQYVLAAIYLFEGALIETLDAFWLTNGKYNWGWSTPNTDGAIITNLVTAVILLAAGLYLFRRQPEPTAGTVVPRAA